MPATGIEKTERSQTVEPGIGDPLQKRRTIGNGLMSEQLHLGGRSPQVGGIGGKNVVELAPHCFQQLTADLGGEVLERGKIHRLIRFPFANSEAMAWRSSISHWSSSVSVAM